MNSEGQAIAKLSIRHETIMDFLMAFPEMNMGEIAKHFGMSHGWMSQVIHSDVFQERLREKQNIAFHHTVLPMREKMQVVAHMALDKLAAALPQETDISNVNKIAENVLDRLGFGSKGGPTLQVNNTNITVLRSEIERAKQVFGHGAMTPALEVETDASGRPIIALPAQREVPGEDPSRLGAAFEGTFLALAEGEHSGTAEGADVREECAQDPGEEVRT